MRYRNVAKFRIRPGMAEEFKQIAAEALAVVRTKDPGTSEYEWFMNDAGTECIVLETYESAEDVGAHAQNVGRLVGKLLQMSQVSVDMLGTPTPQMRETLKRMPISVFNQFQGLK
jgi:quinol monooxygenase YgiN